MSETIKIGKYTKQLLEDIREAEDHTSFDSVIKALTKDREVADVFRSAHNGGLQSQDAFNYMALRAAERPRPERDALVDNRLYVGPLGCGKASVVNQDMHTLLSDHSDVRVIYLDPADDDDSRFESMDAVSDAVDRDVSTVSKSATDVANPFMFDATAISPPPAGSTWDDSSDGQRAKTLQATELVAYLLRTEAEVEEEDMALLRERLQHIIEEVYQAEDDAAVLWPTLDHLLIVARDMMANPASYIDGVVLDGKRDRVKHEAQQLYTALEELVESLDDTFPIPTTGAPETNILAETAADVVHLRCHPSPAAAMATLCYVAECVRTVATDEDIVIVLPDTSAVKPVVDRVGTPEGQPFDMVSRILYQTDRTTGAGVWTTARQDDHATDWPDPFYVRFPTTYLFQRAPADPWGLDAEETHFVQNASTSPLGEDHLYVEYLDVYADNGRGDRGEAYFTHVDWMSE